MDCYLDDSPKIFNTSFKFRRNRRFHQYRQRVPQQDDDSIEPLSLTRTASDKFFDSSKEEEREVPRLLMSSSCHRCEPQQTLMSRVQQSEEHRVPDDGFDSESTLASITTSISASYASVTSKELRRTPERLYPVNLDDNVFE